MNPQLFLQHNLLSIHNNFIMEHAISYPWDSSLYPSEKSTSSSSMGWNYSLFLCHSTLLWMYAQCHYYVGQLYTSDWCICILVYSIIIWIIWGLEIMFYASFCSHHLMPCLAYNRCNDIFVNIINTISSLCIIRYQICFKTS